MKKMLLILLILLGMLFCLAGSMQNEEEKGYIVPSVFVKERIYAESRI